MLTEAWIKLRPHKTQSALWRSKARYVAVVAGRGSGKTECARRRIVRMLPIRKPWGALYAYALPTFKQAKRVAWPELLALTPRSWISNINKTELSIETVFGSTLYVMGMDKPQRFEGSQWDGVVLDESSDQRPGIFDKTVVPALSHRHGWCWRIGVPKRAGIGAQDFKTFFEKGLKNQDGIASYTWPSADVIPQEELEWAQRNLDVKDFEEQYGASWVTIGGLLFYAFDPNKNVRVVNYNPQLPIVVGSDFNVTPMAWVLGHIYNDTLHIFDEVFLRDTNTRSTLDYVYRKYGKHTSGFAFYGDATGASRKTSASMSDYIQIKDDSRFTNSRVFYPKRNPPIVDRVSACNGLILNKEGKRRLFVHPKCTNLINDLSHRSWKDGTMEPNDSGDIGHITDALGYIIHKVFPVSYKVKSKALVFSG